MGNDNRTNNTIASITQQPISCPATRALEVALTQAYSYSRDAKRRRRQTTTDRKEVTPANPFVFDCENDDSGSSEGSILDGMDFPTLAWTSDDSTVDQDATCPRAAPSSQTQASSPTKLSSSLGKRQRRDERRRKTGLLRSKALKSHLSLLDSSWETNLYATGNGSLSSPEFDFLGKSFDVDHWIELAEVATKLSTGTASTHTHKLNNTFTKKDGSTADLQKQFVNATFRASSTTADDTPRLPYSTRGRRSNERLYLSN